MIKLVSALIAFVLLLSISVLTISSFYVSKDNFEKLKKNFDSKPENKRTQDAGGRKSLPKRGTAPERKRPDRFIHTTRWALAICAGIC